MMNRQYQKAIEFAAKAHDGQKRKGDDIPYVSHPFAVAFILHSQDCHQDIVIAGFLHDTVEDTAVTLLDIREEFGAAVAELVGIVTEPDKRLPWEQRKTYMIETIKFTKRDAKYLSCADKLHNLISLQLSFERRGEEIWNRMSRGYAEQKWYAESMLQSLFYGLAETELKPMFYEYERIVRDFFVK
ncbi:bifunctional (p)ppGpp synthetase/guanosine-3',5'-bis(diphosphate) 3'-pyrophosphohydrolase [candidate division KSB1 bacterium]|nr:bifunctional (p)ppGpp synthetase/guanosine-3',5'-bis(diphosphate) 3'-pyrophosphohydrolase [candidate division KSB1 bacterium]